jgi:hypothetical protein
LTMPCSHFPLRTHTQSEVAQTLLLVKHPDLLRVLVAAAEHPPERASPAASQPPDAAGRLRLYRVVLSCMVIATQHLGHLLWAQPLPPTTAASDDDPDSDHDVSLTIIGSQGTNHKDLRWDGDGDGDGDGGADVEDIGSGDGGDGTTTAVTLPQLIDMAMGALSSVEDEASQKVRGSRVVPGV